MSNKPIAYVQSRDSVAFSIDGDMKIIPRSGLNYQRVIDALNTGDLEAVRPLLVPIPQFIADSSDGSITFNDGKLWFEGEELHSSMTTRIIGLIRDGLDVRPLTNFLRNLLDNPSPRAREELYGFLEVNNLPVTTDGYFIAYKMVQADFTDIYTGTMDNSPGKLVKMKRADVDPDKEQTCSVGLHFAALHYVKSGYGSSGRGDKLVAVKINPRDVVAIPTDYNNSKGRACRYLILKELDWDTGLPVNTVGFKHFADETPAEAEEAAAEAAAEAAGGDILTLSPDGATVTRASRSLWSDADIARVKKLLAQPDATLTGVANETGMSRRQVARIRDGLVGQHVPVA